MFPEPVKAAAVGLGAYHGATVQGQVHLSPSLLAGYRAGGGEPVPAELRPLQRPGMGDWAKSPSLGRDFSHPLLLP